MAVSVFLFLKVFIPLKGEKKKNLLSEHLFVKRKKEFYGLSLLWLEKAVSTSDALFFTRSFFCKGNSSLFKTRTMVVFNCHGYNSSIKLEKKKKKKEITEVLLKSISRAKFTR